MPIVPRELDDEQLERALRETLAAGGLQYADSAAVIAELRAEARRRFAGMLGLPARLLGD